MLTGKIEMLTGKTETLRGKMETLIETWTGQTETPPTCGNRAESSPSS